jgi:SAM-dependent methyltransferase
VLEEKRVQWLHQLPRGRPVDREEQLVALSRGKRVVHVGFVDYPVLEHRIAGGAWLHARLAGVASSIVGLDADPEGVAWARTRGYEAHEVDAQSPEAVRSLGLEPADVVVAGEVIEHLDAPGPFLRAMRELVAPDGRVVVTTPNAFRILNFLTLFRDVEFNHPDHTAWHSPHTLRTLLERNGWIVESISYYRTPLEPTGGPGGRKWALKSAANLARRTVAAVSVRYPYWSDGLIAIARPAE